MGVTLTAFRRQLGDHIKAVQTGKRPVVIYSHGKAAAALISIEMLELAYMAQDAEFDGPINHDSGSRMGYPVWREMRAWLSRHFEGTFISDREGREIEAERLKRARQKAEYEARTGKKWEMW